MSMLRSLAAAFRDLEHDFAITFGLAPAHDFDTPNETSAPAPTDRLQPECGGADRPAAPNSPGAAGHPDPEIDRVVYRIGQLLIHLAEDSTIAELSDQLQWLAELTAGSERKGRPS